jgi:D-xylose transport system substrate-binding protein
LASDARRSADEGSAEGQRLRHERRSLATTTPSCSRLARSPRSKANVKKGDIKILGEQAVKDWLPAANALSIAENVLTQFNNKIDGFLGPERRYRRRHHPGSGWSEAGWQSAGHRSGRRAWLLCKRIIAGTQTMTVYKSLKPDRDRSGQVVG